MYNAETIAKYIIDYSIKEKEPVSNLKLQKLLYFVQAQFLVDTDMACFWNPIEAWNFGPVVPSVYNKYKSYGSECILNIDSEVSSAIEKQDKWLIERIVDRCTLFTAAQLMELTQNQTPWIESFVPRLRNVISNKKIKDFFN